MEPDYTRMLGANPARALGRVSVHLSTLGGQDREQWRQGTWVSCEIRADESLARMDGSGKVYAGGVLDFIEDLEIDLAHATVPLTEGAVGSPVRGDARGELVHVEEQRLGARAERGDDDDGEREREAREPRDRSPTARLNTLLRNGAHAGAKASDDEWEPDFPPASLAAPSAAPLRLDEGASSPRAPAAALLGAPADDVFGFNVRSGDAVLQDAAVSVRPTSVAVSGGGSAVSGTVMSHSDVWL